MNTDALIDGILASYDRYGGVNRTGTENFPNRQNVVSALFDLQSLIFPGFRFAEEINLKNVRYVTGMHVNRTAALLTKEIQKALVYTVSRERGNADNIEESHCFQLAETAVSALLAAVPEIRRLLLLDVAAAFAGDPAAQNNEEVILSYPGVQAIVVHRLAHFLFTKGIPIVPRIMSEYVHGKTGIDIHPGATIGESFFIDHGTGVVIGETTIIGNAVKLYQGVTIGALSVEKRLMNVKRHPTIEDNVTIYANATILGGETVIGHDSTIGGNSWITHSIPPHSTCSIE
ncbi:MAG: serine acetyltransferase [Treponema sp.]|nr:serine acetyltransferase [Treponema sp.]